MLKKYIQFLPKKTAKTYTKFLFRKSKNPSLPIINLILKGMQELPIYFIYILHKIFIIIVKISTIFVINIEYKIFKKKYLKICFITDSYTYLVIWLIILNINLQVIQISGQVAVKNISKHISRLSQTSIINKCRHKTIHKHITQSYLPLVW